MTWEQIKSPKKPMVSIDGYQRTPEVEKEQLERQCIKRMLMPEDIAKAVLFFASDQSSGCTAQSYVVDGGVVN